MKKSFKHFLKNQVVIFFILLLCIVFFIYYFVSGSNNVYVGAVSNNAYLETIFKHNIDENLSLRKKSFLDAATVLKSRGCVSLEWNYQKDVCDVRNVDPETCLTTGVFFRDGPICTKFDVVRLPTPKPLKAIYYSAFGASRNDKINLLINWAKTTEINSVVIDVKEINGEVYIPLPMDGFGDIKPGFEIAIRDPKSLIKKLHENGIYVIARQVLFKDKKVITQRPDLAVKKSDKKTIWKDYRGKKWLDPGSKEVWDYNINIAKEAYLLGFDEINLDYVRFPSDGPMSDIYYPISQNTIDADPNWGRSKIMDDFYYYFTKQMREQFPEIVISANVFGQVAINDDDVSIGQILESALLYFDAVSPMAYPSHYSKYFVPFSDGPDNHPYEVIDKTLEKANIKIASINNKIVNAKADGSKIEIRPGFETNLSVNEIQKLVPVEKTDIRLWLQAFTCTWCASSKAYTRTEVKAQEKAIYDNGGDSWMLWNASSRYSSSFFD